MGSKFSLNYYLFLWAFFGHSRQLFNTGFVHPTNAISKSSTAPNQYQSTTVDVSKDKIDEFIKVLQQHPDKIREYGQSLLAEQMGSKKEMNDERNYLSHATNLLPFYQPTRIRLLKYPTANSELNPRVYTINGQQSVLTTRGTILWKRCVNGIKNAVKSIYKFSPLEYLNKKLGMDKGVPLEILDLTIDKLNALKTMSTLNKNINFNKEKEVDRKNNIIDENTKIKDKKTKIDKNREKQYKNTSYIIPLKIKNSNDNNEKINKENKSMIYNKSNTNLKNSSENDKIKNNREHKKNDFDDSIGDSKNSKIITNKHDKKIEKNDKNYKDDKDNDNNSINSDWDSWEESTEESVSKNDKKFSNNNFKNDKNPQTIGNSVDKSSEKYNKQNYKNINGENSKLKESTEGNVSKKNQNNMKIKHDNNDEENLKKIINENDVNSTKNNESIYNDDIDANISDFDSLEKVGKSIKKDKEEIKGDISNDKRHDGKEPLEGNSNKKNHGQYKKHDNKDNFKNKFEESDSSDDSTERFKDYDSLDNKSPKKIIKNDGENGNQSSKKNTLNLSQEENSKDGSVSGNGGSLSDTEDNDFDSADSEFVK